MANIIPSRTATFQAATGGGGDVLINNGRALLHIKNASAQIVTVTAHAIDPCSHGRVHDAIVNVPIGGEVMFGPFPINRFYDRVQITYSNATSVTVASYPTDVGPLSIPQPSEFLLYDSFTRADSAVTAGSAETGQAYTTFGGVTAGINSNRLYFVALPGGTPFGITADVGFADIVAELTYDVYQMDSGIVLRLVDASNFVWVVYDTDRWYLQKYVAGVANTIATKIAPTPVSGNVLKVSAWVNRYEVRLNNQPLIDAVDAGSSFLTATKVGVGAFASVTGRYDNLSVKRAA